MMMMKKVFAVVMMMLLLCSCGGIVENEDSAKVESTQGSGATDLSAELGDTMKFTYDIQMKIGDTPVTVSWENNEAVAALAEMNAGDWHEYQLSMYGGFEQVGPLGSDLPASDSETSTSAGDIVLYEGNQIVVFYGENSWAYTRLGHITDKTADELAELLGNGDVVISLKAE